eukprot:Clim_evm22s199 gene=Clim_evmTU22s199
MSGQEDGERSAEDILKRQARKKVPAPLYKKLLKDYQGSWTKFYKRNEDNFFKDRHWLEREFPVLATFRDEGGVWYEVGCGVGNTIFPFLEDHGIEKYEAYASDIASSAIEIVHSHRLYMSGKITAFVGNIAESSPVEDKIIPPQTVDLATLIFTLSAVPPECMAQALKNVAACMKVGGVVIFRDYGDMDMAMLRFKPGQMIDQNYYVRSDGTFSYFFTLERLADLMAEAGLVPVEPPQMVERLVENRKEEKSMERTFAQGVFRKTATQS